MPRLVADSLTKAEFERQSSEPSSPGGSENGKAMPLGRDLNAARKAFTAGDIEALVSSHDNAIGSPEDHAGEAGDFIKSLVFGGLDGIITTFAIVSAAVGADLSKKTVIVMGLANLIADAISMGLGDALSEKAELDYINREWQRETWEMDNNPAGEIKEMLELYEAEGVSREDSALILTTMAKYKEFFVKHMMIVELGLQTPEEDANPWAKGAVTFSAFVMFGAVPLVSYIIANAAGADGGLLFGLCILFTAMAIFLLGAVKGKFAQSNMIQAGALMTLNGGLAAAASYLIGWGLGEIVPDST
jgi:DNA damage-binding protein 1